MRSPATLIQDIDVIAQALRDEWTAGALSEIQARSLAARLEPDGSWPDLDYDDHARAHWSPGQHTVRLAQLAAAYHAYLHAPAQADKLEHAILAALAFWIQHDPKSDNGWYNSIHTPKYVARTLLLMGDTVSKPIWAQATAILRRSGLTRTGANLTWEPGKLLMLACATRNETLPEQAIEAIISEDRFTTEEGIQPDFSFQQHLLQLYMSNYGEVFNTDNSRKPKDKR